MAREEMQYWTRNAVIKKAADFKETAINTK